VNLLQAYETDHSGRRGLFGRGGRGEGKEKKGKKGSSRPLFIQLREGSQKRRKKRGGGGRKEKKGKGDGVGPNRKISWGGGRTKEVLAATVLGAYAFFTLRKKS